MKDLNHLPAAAVHLKQMRFEMICPMDQVAKAKAQDQICGPLLHHLALLFSFKTTF